MLRIYFDWLDTLLQIMVEIFLLVGFAWIALYLVRKLGRFSQMLAALLSTDALISFFALPAIASMASGHGGILVFSVMLGLIGWHWAVTGHIIRHALDKNLIFSLGLAFLYLLGYNAPEHRILPADYQWDDREALTEGLKKLTAALRPWTLDFHVAQNDGTAYGSGSHDKTGRHCQATDPNGKLDIAVDAGHWLRNENGELTKAFKHICWDGCMFPNSVLNEQKTWNDILAAMIKVRNLNSWS